MAEEEKASSRQVEELVGLAGLHAKVQGNGLVYLIKKLLRLKPDIEKTVAEKKEKARKWAEGKNSRQVNERITALKHKLRERAKAAEKKGKTDARAKIVAEKIRAAIEKKGMGFAPTGFPLEKQGALQKAVEKAREIEAVAQLKQLKEKIESSNERAKLQQKAKPFPGEAKKAEEKKSKMRERRKTGKPKSEAGKKTGATKPKKGERRKEATPKNAEAAKGKGKKARIEESEKMPSSVRSSLRRDWGNKSKVEKIIKKKGRGWFGERLRHERAALRAWKKRRKSNMRGLQLKEKKGRLTKTDERQKASLEKETAKIDETLREIERRLKEIREAEKASRPAKISAETVVEARKAAEKAAEAVKAMPKPVQPRMQAIPEEREKRLEIEKPRQPQIETAKPSEARQGFEFRAKPEIKERKIEPQTEEPAFVQRQPAMEKERSHEMLHDLEQRIRHIEREQPVIQRIDREIIPRPHEIQSPIKAKPKEKIKAITKEIKKIKIVTDFDRVLNYIRENGEVSAEQARNELKIDKESFKKCYAVLEQNGLIEVKYPAMGKARLADVNYRPMKKKKQEKKGILWKRKK